jgi:hypothetical protein
MAGLLTVGAVIAAFFAAGLAVGAAVLITWSRWRAVRQATRPWRSTSGSRSSRGRSRTRFQGP